MPHFSPDDGVGVLELAVDEEDKIDKAVEKTADELSMLLGIVDEVGTWDDDGVRVAELSTDSVEEVKKTIEDTVELSEVGRALLEGVTLENADVGTELVAVMLLERENVVGTV